MASGDSVKKLCEELACPICLGYFKKPVMIISCGHNFCQSCLDQCWEGKEASCPQCREKVQEGDIRPNRQLANLVEVAKELGSQKAEEKGSVCQRHQEPFKLFCKDHEAPICVVCDRSKEHENHKVIPLDEASKEYKDQIWNLLETLKKERKKILAYKADAEKTQREKDRTVAAFRRMHQFLEEQEKILLAKMEEVEKEISAKGEEHLARLSKELSSLSKLIQEMEEKLQQPASELLQVRPRLSPWGAETGSLAVIQSLAVEFILINRFGSRKCLWLLQRMRLYTFIHSFIHSLFTLHLFPSPTAHVTLDPSTAHPQLICSEDLRRVTFGEKEQDLPDNPERFNEYFFVLGQEGFNGGRHFWEVLLGNEGEWSVGVARKSVQRKGCIPFGPHAGIWQVGKCWSEYWFFFNNGVSSSLNLSKESKRVRVTLNYEGGRVAFYDADSAALMYEYSPASFSGETLLPFFSMFSEGHLELSP
uniref:Zinc finger protein RFP-like n=1 Tax=Anolis carolinensis TaxID=28377 RepID=L7MZW0_ANOCA